MERKTSPLDTAIKQQQKRLRADARKLETVAKHLRDQAREIGMRRKLDIMAEKAQANFFTRKSKVDPNLTLTPNLPASEPDCPPFKKNL